MHDFSYDMAYVIYSITALVLCLNMLGLWGYSGAVRGRTKTAWNPEDVGTVAKGAEVITTEAAAVARVLRAHTNAVANIVPFLILALLYVINGCSTRSALILFGGFTVARWGHTFAYLNEKQPWRSLFFGIGGLITIAVMVQVTRGVILRIR
jgi:glutathione S-transferase